MGSRQEGGGLTEPLTGYFLYLAVFQKIKIDEVSKNQSYKSRRHRRARTERSTEGEVNSDVLNSDPSSVFPSDNGKVSKN